MAMRSGFLRGAEDLVRDAYAARREAESVVDLGARLSGHIPSSPISKRGNPTKIGRRRLETLGARVPTGLGRRERAGRALGRSIPSTGRPMPIGVRAGTSRRDRARVVMDAAARGTSGTRPISMGARVGGPAKDSAVAKSVTRSRSGKGRKYALRAGVIGGAAVGGYAFANRSTGPGMSGTSSMYGSSGATGGRYYG